MTTDDEIPSHLVSAGDTITPRLTRRRLLEALAALALASSAAGRALAATAPDASAAPAAAAAPSAVPPAASPAPTTGAAAPTSAALVAAAQTLDAAPLFDPTLGDSYLTALVASVGEEPLARLVALVEATSPTELDTAITRAGLDPVANAVVGSFYSGLTGDGAATHVVTYLFALVWGAATFTKPPSLCGGLFGYWAEPPPGAPSLLAPGAAATRS